MQIIQPLESFNLQASTQSPDKQTRVTCLFLITLLLISPLLYGKNNINDQNIDLQPGWDVYGYVNLVATDVAKQTSKIELDDLSIFLSKKYNSWLNPFIEAEFFSVPLWKNQGSARLQDGHFIFERIYNDVHLNNHATLRIGKFLAPVGLWNLIHAAPLVWTIERPLSTTFSYSNYISGIEYRHTIDAINGKRLDVYYQGWNDIDPQPISNQTREYTKVYGASWTLVDDLSKRSSIDVQYAKVKGNNTRRTTISWQKVWYLPQWDIGSQLIYTKVNGEEASPVNTLINNQSSTSSWDGGGYIQARYHLNSKWNIYSRIERYHFAKTRNLGESILLGMRYRFDRQGNINAEILHGEGSDLIASDSLLISYNSMFKW